MEAQLILNKWYVYKTLCIQVEIIEKEIKKNAQKRKQTVYFLIHICKHNVISNSGCFPHLRESTTFSCLTSSFKCRMQTAFQINLLPFSIAFIRRYTKCINTKKCSNFRPISPLQQVCKKTFDCNFYDTILNDTF